MAPRKPKATATPAGTTEVAVVETTGVTPSQRQENLSIEVILTRAVDKGVPVETMERLLAMRRELKQEHAKEEFDRAMARFQAECPTIVKTKEVRGNSGSVAYRYAPIESIVTQVKEAIQRNGFSYKTDQELKDTGVKVTVRVIHEQGHFEETSMEVPFGSKTQIMSQSQVAAAATTFAKRYAFLNAFGILTGDEDNDGQTNDLPTRAAPARAAAPTRGGVVDREDEPFTAPPPQAPKSRPTPEADRKQMIARYLVKLGHDLGNMKRQDADAAIMKHTGLEMKDENLIEIVNRLSVISAERESVGGSELADEFSKQGKK